MTLKDLLNANDHFGATSGMRLTEVREGYARAEMQVENRHLNAGRVCQGGALFTLADLALAAVANASGQLTLGIEDTITFHHSAFEGDTLTAEAVEGYRHHKIPYCEVKIRNQAGELIATVSGIAYRKREPMVFEGLE